MRGFGQILGYCMPWLLLAGPILMALHESRSPVSLIGAVCLGLGLFALSIKVDLILGRTKGDSNK